VVVVVVTAPVEWPASVVVVVVGVPTGALVTGVDVLGGLAGVGSFTAGIGLARM
jgi:hypothetical protein